MTGVANAVDSMFTECPREPPALTNFEQPLGQWTDQITDTPSVAYFRRIGSGSTKRGVFEAGDRLARYNMGTINDPISHDRLIEASARRLAQGVSKSQLLQLIDEFASFEHWQRRSGAIGRRLLEDIPQSRRPEFLKRLDAL
jgi:hypothetical protein